MPSANYPDTPDGRYFVVRGRLWRKSNPELLPKDRHKLVQNIMNVRRMLKGQRSVADRFAARRSVNDAMQSLDERGPVWWTGGAPDFSLQVAKNTPCAAWFASLLGEDPSTP